MNKNLSCLLKLFLENNQVFCILYVCKGILQVQDVYDLLKRDKINVIVFFYDNDVNYVVMLWVIWMLGVVVFLLNYVYFIEDLEYFLIDFMVLFLLII